MNCNYLFYFAAFVCLMSVTMAGHHGIHVGIPLPFIKIRFVDIAHLFGGHGGHGGHGGGGGFGHGGSFGLELGGGHGGGHHGW